MDEEVELEISKVLSPNCAAETANCELKYQLHLYRHDDITMNVDWEVHANLTSDSEGCGNKNADGTGELAITISE